MSGTSGIEDAAFALTGLGWFLFDPVPRAHALGCILTPLRGWRSGAGIIHGVKTPGVETEADIKWRKEFLRKIGTNCSPR